MKKIYKYPLILISEQYVELPKWRKILCVQMQLENPCIWVEVDTENIDTEMVCFRIYGTGEEHHVGAQQYIGTFQTTGGMFVYHLYYEI